MTGQRKKRIAGSYFVSTLSISLVLVVVGILVFILLNAKLVSDHVKFYMIRNQFCIQQNEH